MMMCVYSNMKNMMRDLAWVPDLALSDVAQENPYKDLVLGDRVEITFHSGSTLQGTLVLKPGEPKVDSVDYTTRSGLTLDVSSEYPGISGTMTVEKKEIKSVRALRALTA